MFAPLDNASENSSSFCSLQFFTEPSETTVPPPTPMPATVQQHLMMSLDHLAVALRQLQHMPITPAFHALIRSILNSASLQFYQLASHYHNSGDFATSLRYCRCASHILALQGQPVSDAVGGMAHSPRRRTAAPPLLSTVPTFPSNTMRSIERAGINSRQLFR
jgi:hypothetical protein